MITIPDIRKEINLEKEVSGVEIKKAVESIALDKSNVFYGALYDDILKRGDVGVTLALGDYQDIDRIPDSDREVIGINTKAGIGCLRIYTGDDLNEPGVKMTDRYGTIGLRGLYNLPPGTTGDVSEILQNTLNEFEESLLEKLHQNDQK